MDRQGDEEEIGQVEVDVKFASKIWEKQEFELEFESLFEMTFERWNAVIVLFNFFNSAGIFLLE